MPGEYRKLRVQQYCWGQGIHRWYFLKNNNHVLDPYRCLDCDERSTRKPEGFENKQELTTVNSKR